MDVTLESGRTQLSIHAWFATASAAKAQPKPMDTALDGNGAWVLQHQAALNEAPRLRLGIPSAPHGGLLTSSG